MKKMTLAVFAILSVSPFISPAQTWSGTTPGNIYYTAGSVGVGTSAPVSAMLQVGSVTDSQPAGYFYNYSTGNSRGLLVEGGISAFDFSADMRNKVGTSLLYVRGDGNVGIGTTTPSSLLDVNGTAKLGDISITSHYIAPYTTDNGMILRGNGTGGILINYASGTGGVAFYNGSTTLVSNIDNTGNGYFAGNVGIGISSPDAKLAVSGTVHAQEVKVDLTGWSDYVFKPTYKLLPLSQVKTYIDQNQHLPDVPSEEELIKNGLNVGEMNKLLMKKVEELTLYLIQQKEDIEKQRSEIEALKLKVNSPSDPITKQ